MRALMPFIGSRGDVQPGLALAHALVARGHQVVFGVPENLVGFVRSTGMECVVMGPNSRELLDSDLVRRRIRQPHPVKRFAALRELASYGWLDLARDLDARAHDADVIITGLLAQEVAAAIAEKHDLPQVALHYCPVRRAETFSAAPVPGASRVRALNRASWSIAEWTWRAMTFADEDRVRRALGLGKAQGALEERMRSRGALEIQVYDPVVFPELYAEWHPRRPFTGFLDLPAEIHRRLNPALSDQDEEWLAAGPEPVFFGFGSMPVADPTAALEMIVAATRRLGMRALVSSGWSDLAGAAETDDRVRVVGAVDHATVLPRCRAAVHHGGAGTTGAVLRAQIPSLVTWFSADQPLWGNQLRALGVGHSVGFRSLDVDRLTAGLSRVLDPTTAARARELGPMLTPQAAVNSTAQYLEHVSEWAYHRRTGSSASR